MIIGVLVQCSVYCLVGAYFLFRNDYVAKYRLRVLGDWDDPNIAENIRRFDKLPSHGWMVFANPFRWEW